MPGIAGHAEKIINGMQQHQIGEESHQNQGVASDHATITKLQKELRDARRDSLVSKQKVRLIEMLESASSSRDTDHSLSESRDSQCGRSRGFERETRLLQTHLRDKDIQFEELRNKLQVLAAEREANASALKHSEEIMSAERLEFRAKLESQEMEIRKWQKREESLQLKNTTLSTMMDSIKKQNQELMTERDEWKKQKQRDSQIIDILKKSNAEQNEQLLALRQKLRESLEENENIRIELREIHEEQSETMAENERLHDERCSECLSLRESVESTSQRSQRCNDIPLEHREDMECVKGEIGQLLNRNEIMERNDRVPIDSVNSEGKSLQTQILENIEKIKESADTISALSAERDDLKEQFNIQGMKLQKERTKLKDKERINKILESTIRQKQGDLDKIKKVNRVLNARNDELEKHITGLIADTQSDSDKMLIFKDSDRKQKEKLVKLEEKLNESTYRIQVLQADRLCNAEESKVIAIENTQLREECLILNNFIQSTVSVTDERLRTYLDSIRALHATGKIKIFDIVQKLKRERDELNSVNVSLEERLKAMTLEKKGLLDAIGKLKQGVAIKEEIARQYGQKLQRMQMRGIEFAEMKDALNKAQLDLMRETDENRQLQAQIDVIRKHVDPQYQCGEPDHEEIIKFLRQSLAEWKGKWRQLNDRHRELKQQHKQYHGQNQKNEEAQNMEGRSLLSENEEMKYLVQKLKLQIETEGDECIQLQSRLDVLNVEIGRLRAESADRKQWESHCFILQETNAILKCKNSELKRSNAMLRGTLQNRMISKSDSTENTTKTLDAESLSFRSEIQLLRRSLDFAMDFLNTKKLNLSAVTQCLSQKTVRSISSTTRPWMHGDGNTVEMDVAPSLVTHLTIQGVKHGAGIHVQRQRVSLNIQYEMAWRRESEWKTLEEEIIVKAFDPNETVLRLRPFFASKIRIKYTLRRGESYCRKQRKCKLTVKAFGWCCK